MNFIGISTILFDDNNKRREKVLSHLEAFARVLWGRYYQGSLSDGGSFSDDELEVVYKWLKKGKGGKNEDSRNES